MPDKALGHERSETLTASSVSPAASSSPAIAGQACLEPGTRVDRYEVIELLGEGSMGSVYRARDTDLARDVALKRISPGRLQVAAAQARLRREARAMAQVEHAAVIRIYDVVVVEGELFVAMELARGGTVAAWLRAQPRRWREIVQVFIQAGRGLAAAHQVGLVHRDIKPSNILLDGHGRAKIGDFGLARMFGVSDDGEEPVIPVAELDATITRTGAIAGTLAYMAPEQLSGELIDARADQFAFCVTLWEALCGRRPFGIVDDSVRTPEAFLEPIVAGSVAGPPADTQVPGRVLALVRRGLTADRARRWRSLDELLDALDRAVRPRRWWWAAAALAVLAAAAIVVVARGSEPAPSVMCGQRDQIAAAWNPIVRVQYVSRAPSAPAAEEAGWFDWYAHTLDAGYAAACSLGQAQRIACLDGAVDDLRAAIARTTRQYWPRLRALDRCGIAWNQLDLGSLAGREYARLSADKQHVMGWTYDDPPTVRDLGGGGRRSFDLASPRKWLSDGSIVGDDQAGRLAVVDPSTGQTRRVFDLRDALDVSSDLRTVARVSDGKLTIAPIAGGPPLIEPMTVGERMVEGEFSPDNRRFAMLFDAALHVDDLGSRHRETIGFRLHLNATGFTQLRWLDPNSVVISGSATVGIADDVWRVRVDATGHLAEPPQIVLAAERDTVLQVDDVQSGSLLIRRTVIAAQTFLLDGDSTKPLPGWLSQLRPIAADRSRRRVLAASNVALARWAWVSLDGSSVQPIAALDGLRVAVVGPSGLAALDLRGDRPIYVAFDEAGTELARVPIEAARGAEPSLRCGASRCVAKWFREGATFLVEIEGSPPAVGPVIRHDRLDLGTALTPWELSPDGKQIAVATHSEVSGFVLYDLEHHTAQALTSSKCRPQRIWFLPDGALLLSGLDLEHLTAGQFVVVRRDASGERLLWHGDGWVGAAAPLDASRVIAFARLYQARLVLFETR